jgi:hypothetical protein
MMDCQVKPNDGLVPRTQRSAPLFAAWCAAEPGPYQARCLRRSRFCEATLRKSYALHRARDTIGAGNDENQLNTTTKPTTIRQQPMNASIGQLVRGRS